MTTHPAPAPESSSGLTGLVPLGDQAALAYFRDEEAAARAAALLHQHPGPGFEEVVQAYASLAVFYDLDRTTFAAVATGLRELLTTRGAAPPAPGPLHEIPCCYDFALDLPRVTGHTGLAAEEVIRLHTATLYTVYAIGFCPGFPYLGYLPTTLCGVPRLPSPRLRVEAGSVGLTGRQTGIYTEARPGGWNLVGRTPLELVNVADRYFPLATGDRVRFVRIDEAEFQRLRGERLPR